MIRKIFNKYKRMPVQVRASFWFLICSFLQKGISVVTTPIFTRLLTTADYGQYNVFNSWLGIITIFVSLNLSLGVFMQGMVKFSDNRRKYASSLQGLSLTLTIIWTIIYLIFHEFWNKLFSLTTVQMLAMLVMIWATAAFTFWSTEQRVEYKYRNLVIATLIVSLAKPLVGIFFVIHSEDKVTARILGLALVELIGYTGFFIIQMIRGKQFFSEQYWTHALRFNIPLIPHYLSSTVLNSADRIMIKNYAGASDAGVYSLAYSISQIMILFNTALNQTLGPWIYKNIKEKRTDDIAGIAYISLGIIAFVNLVLIAITPEAVAVFAPPSYHAAIWVIPPVAMSVIFIFSYDLFAKFEFYYEKSTWIMFASVLGAALNVGLNYLFIRQYGYYAAAYTTLICYIIYAAAHYFFMKKICSTYLDGVQVYDPKILLLIYGVFIISGFALMLTYIYPIVRYSIIASVFILVIMKRKMLIEQINKIIALRRNN